MITSFFKTSKPIHYIFFTILLLVLFFYQRVFEADFEINVLNCFNESAHLLVLIASLFTLVFIITKNNLTNNNSLAALFFCLFIGLLPEVLDSTPKLIANFFILLSLRRIVSLKNKKNIKKKILDATLWICLAILFDSISIFFFAPLFIGLALYSALEIKNILITFYGFLAFGILLISFGLAIHDQLPTINEYLPVISFETRNLSLEKNVLYSLVVVSVTLLGIVSYFLAADSKNRLNRPSMLLFVTIIITSFIAFLFSQSDGKDIYIFIVAPSAILMANFSETTKLRWMPDLILVSLFTAIFIKIIANIS